MLNLNNVIMHNCWVINEVFWKKLTMHMDALQRIVNCNIVKW